MWDRHTLGARCSSVVRAFSRGVMGRRIVSLMVDCLSYFSFQPVLQDWCNKGRGICYPVCGMMHIKEPLLLVGKSSPFGGSGFPLSVFWLQIAREEIRCRHIGYSYRLTAMVLLYAPSHRQDSTYHGLCYTSRGALAGTRNRSMGPPHEGSIRRPIAPWSNALPLSYVPLLNSDQVKLVII